MALIQIDFFSTKLRRLVPVKAIIPNDFDSYPGMEKRDSLEEMKTLYLLHGYSGNYADWICGSRIQEYAVKYNLAVIMPSGENSFYLDDEEKSEFFGEFIGKELVEYTRRVFRLSSCREDTFIGGLSMGGYGALRNGLKYAEVFSKIMSFSGAFIQVDIIENGAVSDDEVTSASYKRRIFGDPAKLERSDKNPIYLMEQLKKNNETLPEIMMTCGLEDFLLTVNRKVKRQLEDFGVQIKYIEDSGVHNWDFWNKHLEEALDWALDA